MWTSSERFGDFSYEIPVPGPGLYDIKLHYAELFHGVGEINNGVGNRLFNVNIEGNQALTNFDILSEADPVTALIKEFRNMEITDGFASFHFVSLEDNAKISGIEIVPIEKTIDENEELLPGAQVSVFAADTLNTTTFTDQNGMYTVMGLIEGKYNVEVELNGYKTQRINGVPITEANMKKQDFVLEPYP